MAASEVLRYPAEVGRFNKWLRFDVRKGRHVGRGGVTTPEANGKDDVVMAAALYLPTSALQSRMSVEYGTVEFSGMMMEMAAQSISDLMNMRVGVDSGASVQDAAAALVQNALKIVGEGDAGDTGEWLKSVALGAAGDFGNQIAALGGVKANPRTDILFTAQDYRTWTFDYILIPRSYAEAVAIRDIMRMFNFYMLPSYRQGELGPASAYMMGYPYEFTIGVFGTDTTSIAPSVTRDTDAFGGFQNNTFGKLITNNEKLELPPGSAGRVLENVQQIGRSVLKNLTVDQAGGGKVAFVNSRGSTELFPLVTTMTLEFQEVVLRGRDNLDFFGGKLPAGGDPRG